MPYRDITDEVLFPWSPRVPTYHYDYITKVMWDYDRGVWYFNTYKDGVKDTHVFGSYVYATVTRDGTNGYKWEHLETEVEF